ncbi:hypothetical protein BDR26DRAFT_924153 [Obelidium mucronatum]|nr:hypothetical protein BDR26DRAFT_924153 [Obelidium mucronatum]
MNHPYWKQEKVSFLANPVLIEFDLPVSLLETHQKELDDGQYTVTAWFGEHLLEPASQVTETRRLEGNVISPSLLSELIGLIKETSVQTRNKLENRRIGRWNPDMKSVDDIINVLQMREENDELAHKEISAVNKGEQSNESLMSQKFEVGLGHKYAKDKTIGTQKDTSKHHGSTLAGSGSVSGFGVKAKGSGTHSHGTKTTNTVTTLT